MNNYKTLVQNKIIELVQSVEFKIIEYNHDGEAYVGDVDIGPETIETNEVSCGFIDSKHYGRFQVYEREFWIWVLLLAWNKEVSLQEFEDIFLSQQITIPASSEFKQISLKFLNADYQHPPRMDAVTGTKVKYTIEAKIWPK